MITTKTRAPETASVQLATMKAIVQNQYGTSEVLELRDITRPEIGKGDVLVRVRAAGVNPADWAIVGGLPYIEVANILGGTADAARRAASDGISTLRTTFAGIDSKEASR